MGLNSPLSSGLGDDITKASKVLSHFLSADETKYTNKIIPIDILEKCKGIAVLTVIKGGFIWSGRAGTGIVVARLSDGSWSAPSAIGTAGVGFGGQIGGQITDFVMILNTDNAVKAFSRGGNVTLGASVAIAAGPTGRSAEVGGTIREIAPIYSYSKSKGLFAGISLEGSAILERKDANEKFYGHKVSTSDILSGNINPPHQAHVLYDAIRFRNTQPKGYIPRTNLQKDQQTSQILQSNAPVENPMYGSPTQNRLNDNLIQSSRYNIPIKAQYIHRSVGFNNQQYY